MSEQLEVGDVVWLKSGSAPMTVTEVDHGRAQLSYFATQCLPSFAWQTLRSVPVGCLTKTQPSPEKLPPRDESTRMVGGYPAAGANRLRITAEEFRGDGRVRKISRYMAGAVKMLECQLIDERWLLEEEEVH